MIIEWLVEVALSLFDLLMSIIPDMNLSGVDTAIAYFFDILSGVCYFFPMGTVSAIFSIVYSLFILRLLIAILKTIWGIIPVL